MIPSMRRFALSIGFLAGLVSAVPAAGPRPPEWKKGQNWSVSVRMEARRHEEHAPGDSAPPGHGGFVRAPSVPTMWFFEVLDAIESDDKAVRRFRVRARRSGRDGGAELRFVTRLHEGKPVAMALEKVHLDEGSGTYERDFRDMAPEPSPAMVAGAPVPLSFPFLDPLVPDQKTFTITEDVGGLGFALDVEQRVVGGKAAKEAAARLGIEAGERPVWLIELRRKTDGQFSNQVWVEGDPWPARVVANQVQSTLLGRGAGG